MDLAMGPSLVVKWSDIHSLIRCRILSMRLTARNSTPSGRRHGATISSSYWRTRHNLSLSMRLFQSFAPIRTLGESLGRNIERKRDVGTRWEILGRIADGSHSDRPKSPAPKGPLSGEPPGKIQGRTRLPFKKGFLISLSPENCGLMVLARTPPAGGGAFN